MSSPDTSVNIGKEALLTFALPLVVAAISILALNPEMSGLGQLLGLAGLCWALTWFTVRMGI